MRHLESISHKALFRRSVFARLIAGVAFAVVGLARAAGAEPPKLDFNRDVRPILSENCFACHGADKHKGNLRLDLRAVATKPAKSGDMAIVPGKSDQSELVRRITSEDEDEHMPPEESHKKLTAGQIEILRRWIAEGAVYAQHWAFAPPVWPALPAVQNAKWVRNPIDRFILARLEAEKLSPSPEAEKVMLLRRLHLDLIGLPPTIVEIDACLGDTSPDALTPCVRTAAATRPSRYQPTKSTSRTDAPNPRKSLAAVASASLALPPKL